MTKQSARYINLDPDNLFANVDSLAIKFRDLELPNPNTVWSSSKVKNLIDTLAQGLDSKNSCRTGTIEALPSCIYNNGTDGVGATLTSTTNSILPDIDGVTLNVGDRILVKDQTSNPEQNGIYLVSNLGSLSTPWILIRSIDFDNSPNGEVTGGAFTFIEEGGLLEDQGWVLTTNGDITIGTTALFFSQFSGTGSVLAGTGLSRDNQLIHIGDGSLGNINGINRTSDDIEIATGIGLELNSDLLRISSTAVADGLTGGSGNALSVLVSDLAGFGIEADGSNNLRISSSIAGNGLTGGSEIQLSVVVSDIAGFGLEDDGSNNLRISSSIAGNGLTGGSGASLAVLSDSTGGLNLAKVIDSNINGISIKVDNVTVGENLSNQLYVLNNSITQNHISSLTLGNGLKGGSGTVISVEPADIAGFGLEDDGADNLRIATTAAGNGLIGGGGTALAVQADTTGGANLATVINSSANGVAVKIDDSTVAMNASSQLIVKANGITPTQLNTSVAGNGLTGGGGTALAVNPAALVTGGVSEIDGDKLNVDYTPTNYTPTISPTSTDVDDLSSHLYGIDQAFGDISQELFHQEMHTITTDEYNAGFFYLEKMPVNAQAVRATVFGGIMEINNAAVGDTGETPDFAVFNLYQLHINNNGEASGLSSILEIGDTLILEYEYQIETGLDGNGDLIPIVGETISSLFEDNGAANIMPTTSGSEHEYFELIGDEIVPKE